MERLLTDDLCDDVSSYLRSHITAYRKQKGIVSRPTLRTSKDSTEKSWGWSLKGAEGSSGRLLVDRSEAGRGAARARYQRGGAVGSGGLAVRPEAGRGAAVQDLLLVQPAHVLCGVYEPPAAAGERGRR